MNEKEPWLNWAAELQSLAQAGLYYGKDPFDLERYQRIRDIAAEMVAHQCELPLETVKGFFCNETGYQTPKMDTRSAIFQGEKILLVQELDGTWALPGGWVDFNVSVRENAIKEVKEEAGLDVSADLLIAVLDKDKHHSSVHPFKICTSFVLCTVLGGSFTPNIETVGSRYFGLDELPPLSLEKTTAEEIALCFEAYHAQQWTTVFD